jgi:hypothetical protein
LDSRENQTIEEKSIAKYTIKDSVFYDLFRNRKYLIQLYRALPPEDKVTTENELKDNFFEIQ